MSVFSYYLVINIVDFTLFIFYLLIKNILFIKLVLDNIIL